MYQKENVTELFARPLHQKSQGRKRGNNKTGISIKSSQNKRVLREEKKRKERKTGIVLYCNKIEEFKVSLLFRCYFDLLKCSTFNFNIAM